MNTIKIIGYFIFVPRLVTNLFRSQEELDSIDSKKFDNLIETIRIIKKYIDRAQDQNVEQFQLIAEAISENTKLIGENKTLLTTVNELAEQNKNLTSDNADNINRNKILIDSITETIETNTSKIESNLEAINKLKEDIKKASIKIYSNSSLFPDNDEFTDEELKKSLKVFDPEVSTNEFGGMVFDEDSGLDVNVITDNNKEYATIKFDKDILKKIPFINNKSSVEIEYDEDEDQFVITPAPILLYESEVPEREITLDHNFDTQAIDIKVFKIVPNQLDMREVVFPKIEYTSPNQVKFYFTYDIEVHIIISKI